MKKILIVKPVWHESSVDVILGRIIDHLLQADLPLSKISVVTVPGCFDMIAAADKHHHGHDLIFCTGFILKGVTDHYKYTSLGVIQGMMGLTLKTGKPVVNGIFNCQDESQISAKVEDGEVAKSMAISIMIMLNGHC